VQVKETWAPFVNAGDATVTLVELTKVATAKDCTLPRANSHWMFPDIKVLPVIVSIVSPADLPLEGDVADRTRSWYWYGNAPV